MVSPSDEQEPSLTPETRAAVESRLAYLSEIEEVVWWSINADATLHIGTKDGTGLDVLNSAVGWVMVTTGQTIFVRGYLYDASRHSEPQPNGEGARCKSEGRERVGRTQCLRDGQWVKPDGVPR